MPALSNIPHCAPSPAPPCVLVTGAAKRLGREIALLLAAHGWGVALHYRHSAAEAAQTLADCQQAAAAAGHSHGCFAALPADLADEAAARALVPQAVAALIDGLRRLDAESLARLDTAAWAARDAARDAAWDAAWDATWDATWDAAWDAARDAALATLVRDLITPKQYDLLMAPWRTVIGDQA